MGTAGATNPKGLVVPAHLCNYFKLTRRERANRETGWNVDRMVKDGCTHLYSKDNNIVENTYLCLNLLLIEPSFKTSTTAQLHGNNIMNFINIYTDEDGKE